MDDHLFYLRGIPLSKTSTHPLLLNSMKGLVLSLKEILQELKKSYEGDLHRWFYITFLQGPIDMPLGPFNLESFLWDAIDGLTFVV